MLLALTLGGGLAADRGRRRAAPGCAAGSGRALIVAVAVLAGVLALPLAWYRTFVIEERFGFNRMTLRLGSPTSSRALSSAQRSACRWPTLVLWLMQRAGAWWWL